MDEFGKLSFSDVEKAFDSTAKEIKSDSISSLPSSVSLSNPPPVPKRPRPKPTPSNIGQLPIVSNLNAFKQPPFKSGLLFPRELLTTDESKSRKFVLEMGTAQLFCTFRNILVVFNLSDNQIVNSLTIEDEISCMKSFDNNLWIGTTKGSIFIYDTSEMSMVDQRHNAHGRNQIIQILTLKNSIHTLDCSGLLLAWTDNRLSLNTRTFNLPRSSHDLYDFDGKILAANGKSALLIDDESKHTFDPNKEGFVNIAPVISVTRINDSSIVSIHQDGKLILWDASSGLVCYSCSLGPYKVTSAVKSQSYIWIGLSTGRISVLDVGNPDPSRWNIVSEWKMHESSILKIIELDSIASVSDDGVIYLWDPKLHKAKICND